MARQDVFITGGTGYIGGRLIPDLLTRGHRVRALVRAGSEGRVPECASVVVGNALDAESFASTLHSGDTFVHLVGTPPPGPSKAKEFRSVDLPSVRAAVSAARRAAASHFVYVSVAQPAPVMRAFVEVRAEGEKAIAEAELTSLAAPTMTQGVRERSGRKRGNIVIVSRVRERHPFAMRRHSPHPEPSGHGLTRTRTLRVAMLAYPDIQILDVTGPLEVFSRTSRWLKDNGKRSDDAYSVEILGVSRGSFRTSSGLRLYADRRYDEVGRGIDTLLIAGGKGMERFRAHPSLLRWIRRQAGWVRRLASVCTGTFFLAEAGLLKDRRATTHWGWCARLARQFPDVRVEPDTIFVKEGSIYTSAGVTAGMDLALALVEEDHGREVALAVARELVLFLRRPGGQAQFSAQLAVQLAEHEPLRELQAYILEHPRADLSVETLARKVAMSPRNFARVFTREVETTPARFVTSVRIETARRLLEESTEGLETISTMSGLGTPESMRRAFIRSLGIPPGQYRERFNRLHSSRGRSADAFGSRRLA